MMFRGSGGETNMGKIRRSSLEGREIQKPLRMRKKEAKVLSYKLNYFTSSLCNNHEAIQISVAFPVARQFLKSNCCWKPVF